MMASRAQALRKPQRDRRGARGDSRSARSVRSGRPAVDPTRTLAELRREERTALIDIPDERARFRGAETRATRKPKSPAAASISPRSIRAPCKLVYTGTFSCAESYWMHSARSGATIFFGHGPRAARRYWSSRCE